MDRITTRLQELEAELTRVKFIIGNLAGMLVRKGVLTEEEAAVWRKILVETYEGHIVITKEKSHEREG